MNSNSIAVGKDILSYCNKCKLSLSHTIVSMVGPNKIAKVKCNTCKGIHQFKDPSTAITRKKTTTSRKRTSAAENNENVWKDAMNKAKGNYKDYTIRAQFAMGDVLNHPNFGPGIVDKKIDEDKIQVIFQGSVKTLVHNK